MPDCVSKQGPGPVCRVLARCLRLYFNFYFTWKKSFKIDLQDHAKISAYWPRELQKIFILEKERKMCFFEGGGNGSG